MPKTSSIRPVVSIQYRLVTDGRDNSVCHASIASRGKNLLAAAAPPRYLQCSPSRLADGGGGSCMLTNHNSAVIAIIFTFADNNSVGQSLTEAQE